MQLKQICVFVSFLVTCTSSHILDISNKPNHNGLSDEPFISSAIECINLITKKHLPCGNLITLVSTSTFMNRLFELLSDDGCYCFITRSNQQQKWPIWSNSYVISLQNFTHFISSFKDISRDFSWNPKAHFIILVRHLEQPKFDQVFALLMKMQVYNVLLITESEESKLKLITYNPFDNYACGQSFDDLIYIENCKDVEIFKPNYKYLENKFRNCTITIAAIDNKPSVIINGSFIGNKNIVGVEQKMLSNMAEKENITLNYLYTEVLYYNSTNNFIGLIVGGLPLMPQIMKIFDSIWGYNYDNFYISSKRNKNNWKKVRFSYITWILIVVSYCLIHMGIKLVHRYYIGRDTYLALTLWGYMFNNTSSRLVRIKKLRVFVTIWIWLTFFITNFYNSASYKFSTSKHKTISGSDKDLTYVLSLKPCISNKIRVMYKFLYNETLPGPWDTICKDTNAALDKVANSEKFYTIVMKDGYKMRKSKYFDKEGNEKIDVIRSPNDVMLAMYTRRGFPLHEKFQKYARYHAEAGLIQHYKAMIFHAYNIFHKHIGKQFHILNWRDLRCHFSMLFIGYIISSICFIVEINK